MIFEKPASYLPHRPPMLLVGEVGLIDEESVTCYTDVGESGPVAEVMEEGVLPGHFLVEMMAQTVGVWAGFHRNNGKIRSNDEEDPVADIGLLLSVRSMKVYTASVAAGMRLCIVMHKLIQDGGLATFEGKVLDGEIELATGRVTVYQPKVSELGKLFGQ